MTNDTALIRLEKVSKYLFRGAECVHALEGVSLTIFGGDYLAVVGHSGAGKTTLLNIIGCLDRPSRGSVHIAGREVHNASEGELTQLRRSTFGFVFQQFFLIPTLTVLENVALPSLFARKKSVMRARELVEMVGLEKRMHHLPSQLSGGEMQRVAIARSIINEPSILLADEPTGSLDTKNATEIMNLFDRLHESGITVILVTHNMDLVKRCKRVVHIEDGKIKT